MKRKFSILFFLCIIFCGSIKLNSFESPLLDFYLNVIQINSSLDNIKIINKKSYEYPNQRLISTTVYQYDIRGLIISDVYYSSTNHSLSYFSYINKSGSEYFISMNYLSYRLDLKDLKSNLINKEMNEFHITFDENKLVSNGNFLTEIIKKENTFEIKHYENCYLLFNCLIAEEVYDSLMRPIYKNYINPNMVYSYTYKGDTTYMDVDFERSPLRSSDQFIVNTKTVKNAKERKVYEEEIFNPDVYNLVEISLLNSFGQDSVTYKMRENDQGKLDTLTIQKYYYEFYDENE